MSDTHLQQPGYGWAESRAPVAEAPYTAELTIDVAYYGEDAWASVAPSKTSAQQGDEPVEHACFTTRYGGGTA